MATELVHKQQDKEKLITTNKIQKKLDNEQS